MRIKGNKDIKISQMKYPNISIGYDEDGRRIEFKGGVLGQTVRVEAGKKNKERVRGKYIELINESDLENSRDYCP